MNYSIFSCIKICNGYNRSLLLDLLRNKYEIIDNRIANILNKSEIDFKLLKKSELNELLKKEYIFEIPLNYFGSFPSLEPEIQLPLKVDLATISLSSSLDIEVVFEFLHKLNINNVRLVQQDIDDVTMLYHDKLFQEKRNVNFYMEPEKNSSNSFEKIILEKKDNVYPKFFLNQKFYFESLNYNTFYNGKLFINSKGDVFPDEKSIHICGNIYDILTKSSYLELLKKLNSALWNVSKSKINICSDCELKNICLTNQLPINFNKNRYFFKEECPYNPYISKWKGENGYKNLKECGVISNETEFSIDHEKIKQINHELWGE